jgi:hypothetical protein
MKTQKCFTLSPEVQQFIEDFAKKIGTSQSSAVEIILREKAQLSGVELKVEGDKR